MTLVNSVPTVIHTQMKGSMNNGVGVMEQSSLAHGAYGGNGETQSGRVSSFCNAVWRAYQACEILIFL